MKVEDVVGLGLVLVCVTFLACVLSYTTAHSIGYKKGIWHSRLYYETTGNFPSRDWVSHNEDEHLYHDHDIIIDNEPFRLRED